MLARLTGADGIDGVYADYLRFGTQAERRVRVGPTAALALRNNVGACFLYRRDVHEELGGFDESLFLAEDYDFWLRAMSRFRFVALHEVLYRYRDHDGSLTARRGAEAHIAAWRAVERHLSSLEAPLRAEIRLSWARDQFAIGQSARARENVWYALAEAPRIGLRRTHRAALTRAVFGIKLARAAERVAPAKTSASIQVVLPDALGGVASFVSHVARARPDDAPPLDVCWVRQRSSKHAAHPGSLVLPARRTLRVAHDWPAENLFALLRRMRRAVGPGSGVLVANDFIGLAYAAWRDPGRSVVQILHGDAEAHYQLAERYGAHVDAFVAVSARIRDELARRLPGRTDHIHLLPSGVPIPERTRRPAGGPLRVVYSGRLDRAKGALDLPEIDRQLAADGWEVRWTLFGAGPDEAALRRAFDGCPRVEFAGALAPDEVADRLADHDAFVLPSRVEGLPLALLEAMAAGLVPVCSNLASGVRDVVDPGENGFLVPVGEPTRFAEAIATLARDRALLERASTAAAARVRARFDVKDRARAFFDLLRDLCESPRAARPGLRRGPSRLDRPWLPNPLVRAIRRMTS
jgi:glycosyltransferase involved in cell wall biosynthesis